EGLIAADHHASAGGLAPAARAAEFDGLTGDDGGGGLTNVHRVSVHHPSHGLLAGAHVRRRDVAFRTEPVRQFRSVAAGQPLKFAARHFPRIANHSAFRATKRNIYDRALPSHPFLQSPHFVDGYTGGKTDSAL